MDAQTPWFVWTLAGLALGTISTVSRGALSGLLLFAAIIGAPIYIFMVTDRVILPFVCFLVGLAIPVSLSSWRQTRLRHEAYRLQLEEQRKRRGNFGSP
jgi:hypothetical protein